jgi:hypothetical protein
MTTSLTQDVRLANFAALSYKSDGLINEQPPAGWTLLRGSVDDPFAAFAYQNLATKEIVITYRGTDGINDAPAILAIAAGKRLDGDTHMRNQTDNAQGLAFIQRQLASSHPITSKKCLKVKTIAVFLLGISALLSSHAELSAQTSGDRLGDSYPSVWWRAAKTNRATAENMYFLTDKYGRRIVSTDEVYLITSALCPRLACEGYSERELTALASQAQIRSFSSNRKMSYKGIKRVDALKVDSTNEVTARLLKVELLNGSLVYFISAVQRPSESFPTIKIDNVKTWVGLPLNEIDWASPGLVYDRQDLYCNPVNNMLTIQLTAESKPKDYLLAALGPPINKSSGDSTNAPYWGKCFGPNQRAILEPTAVSGLLSDGTVILQMSALNGYQGFLRIRPADALPGAYLPDVVAINYAEFSRFLIIVNRRTSTLGCDDIRPQTYCTAMDLLQWRHNFQLVQLFLFPQTAFDKKTVYRRTK